MSFWDDRVSALERKIHHHGGCESGYIAYYSRLGVDTSEAIAFFNDDTSTLATYRKRLGEQLKSGG